MINLFIFSHLCLAMRAWSTSLHSFLNVIFRSFFFFFPIIPLEISVRGWVPCWSYLCSFGGSYPQLWILVNVPINAYMYLYRNNCLRYLKQPSRNHRKYKERKLAWNICKHFQNTSTLVEQGHKTRYGNGLVFRKKIPLSFCCPAQILCPAEMRRGCTQHSYTAGSSEKQMPSWKHEAGVAIQKGRGGISVDL